MKTYQLTTIDRQRSTPTGGEDLGAALAKAAQDQLDAMREAGRDVGHWAHTVGHMLHLAADAFDAGASVTIGHNRSDRYMQRAKELRLQADALYAEAVLAHEDANSAALLKAYEAGRKGEDASRFSFDRREAYFIGRHVGLSQPLPAYMRSVYQDRDHWLDVDGRRFKVEYPDGRIDPATVKVTAL